ncbi:MAG: hypothetical protein AB7M12_14045 [Hyphomonadaceae bacterium]
MANALETFIAAVRSDWGPLSTELVAKTRQRLQTLLQAPCGEPWLAALIEAASPSTELYRDPAHGFVLLAHTETAGLYRPPHDHGRSWVIYAVQHGEIDMGGYGRVTEADGRVRLVKRDATPVRAGQVQIYLPGDIHDTRCMTDTALLFRFTERDLKIEDQRDHRITRYVDAGGVWTAPKTAAASA